MKKHFVLLPLALLMGLMTFAACATFDYEQSGACAFENTETGECVVDFVCHDEDPELCGVVIDHLRSRSLGETPATNEPGTARVCDDSPILCTCCDVKSGCYPCPTKVVQ